MHIRFTYFTHFWMFQI